MGRPAIHDGLTAQQRYAKRHAEKRRAAALARYHATKEQVLVTRKEYQAAYRAARRQELAEYQRQYRVREAEAISARRKAAWPFTYEDKRDEFISKSYTRRSGRQQATTMWARKDLIRVVYKKARQLGLHVDHIVPLNSDIVCGLHVWWNLQLLDHKLNNAKSNRVWPDMPEARNGCC